MEKTNTVQIRKVVNFFSLMIVYQNGRNNQGGQPGNILRDANADVWQQLRKENNSKLSYMNALNAKFMDDDIIVILFRFFGEHSIMAK